MLKGLIGDAQGQRVESDIQTIKVALGAYERNNYFKPPTEEQGLEALVTKPTSDPQPEKWRQYMDEVPKDPWGNEYQFRFPAQRSKTDKYDLFFPERRRCRKRGRHWELVIFSQFPQLPCHRDRLHYSFPDELVGPITC